MAAPALTLKNISVQYANGVTGLRPTSLSFRRDQFTVLLGASGAGKSTLLRSINHLVTPSGGEIHVDGIGVISGEHALRTHRRQTAMVFQQHHLINRHTALENVLLGRIGHYSGMRTLFPLPQKDHLLALTSLQRVGLIEKALERCDALSGGQQQRVGIARALCQQPKLILADEPVASLDPNSARGVMGHLKQVCREDGIPVIVSLHQIDYALDFADRVVGLKAGAVAIDALPADFDRHQIENLYSDGVGS